MAAFGITHIPIKQPNENSHNYYCCKMKYLLNCQTTCNEKGKFIDVEVKWPGSVHNARIIFRQKIPINCKDLTPGRFYVPQVILGDPVYPLLP